MSANMADSRFSFELPSLSYIDAKWEEPSLRAPAPQARPVRRGGVASWLSRQAAAFFAWRREQEAAADLGRIVESEQLQARERSLGAHGDRESEP